MINIVRYTNCPVCGSPEIKLMLSPKDYTVSGQTFPIVECGQCSLRFTQDVPDERSIGPYYKAESYISHTNTSKGLINRIYKTVRRKTLVRKRKLVEKFTGKKNGKLLDVGSGTGSFVNEMKQAGWETLGLEPDEDARRIAGEQHQLELAAPAVLYNLPQESFDAVTLWHVLEHVHDLNGYIRQLKKILAPAGRLFIAVPNYTSLDAKIYGEFWAAYDVPRHLYHFSPLSMQTLMEKNGLRIIQYKPMWYDSFYISLLSSKYKNGRSNLLAAGFNGLRSNIKAMSNVKKCSSLIYIIEK